MGLFATPASAEVVMAGPGDDVEALINALEPGDELVLADGMYELTERFSFDIAGTEAMPIVIRAADGATPHFHRPDASQNIWDFGAEHVTIRGLTFSGGSAGLRVEGGATYLTIEDCEIYDTEDVALRMNDGGAVYDHVQILHNHIHDTSGTGEGMYLGCNTNGCQVQHSLIAGNYLHHMNGPGISQGDGIELKEGSFDNVIRDNVIHDTNYPCILTYSTVGNGSPNVIERNVMWNCGDHAIQSAADAVIRNNIILSANGSGIASQPHQSGAPSNMEIVHNTIVKPGGDAVSIRGATGTVLIANNALYAMSGDAIFVNGPTDMITVAGNVGQGGSALGGYTDGDLASDFVMGSYDGAPPIDLFPAAGGALVGAGDAAHVVTDDFNGTLRMGVADVGAYAFAEGGNPGWPIGEGFKEETPVAPGSDAGVPGADGGAMPGTDGGTVPGTDGSVSRTDAGGTTGGGDDDDGGCGCRTIPSRSGAPWHLLAVALLALASRRFYARMRRRGTRRSSV